MQKHCSVVIVGAGPVGLCLALQLTQQGVPVCVIESLPEPAFLDQPRRAGTIHPSTLEMLDDIGLYSKLEPRGLIAPTMAYWDRQSGEMLALFDHAVLKDDTRFPYVLQCERLKIVDEAMQLLKSRSIADIRMGTMFKDCTQDENGITATIINEAGETETISGSYIVSCEGPHSIIRKSLDIEFEGYTYPDRTMILSVVYDFDQRHGYAPRNYLSDPVEWANLFKWPELWRVVFGTNIDDEPETVMSDASIRERLQRLIPDASGYEVLSRSLYTVHQRVAATFRGGRALLAGDAAHVTTPIGGLGMNSGIHDACNLGEKLCAVIARGEDDSLLDRYSRQRRHVAVNYTKAQTEKNKRLLEEKDPAIRKKNHDLMRKTVEDPQLARDYLLRASLIKSVREAAQIN